MISNRSFSPRSPSPTPPPPEREEIGILARELQELHTLRRDTIAKLDQRLHSGQTAPVSPAPKEDWLWSEVGTPATWKQSPTAPADLKGRDLTAWAKQQYTAALQARLDTLDAHLHPGASLTVTNTADELALHIDGRQALRLYDRPDTPFLAAQWRHALRGLNVTQSFDAKKLVRLFLNLRAATEEPLKARILTLDQEITTIDQTIQAREATLNAHTYRLYHLTPEEIAMVEGG